MIVMIALMCPFGLLIIKGIICYKKCLYLIKLLTCLVIYSGRTSAHTRQTHLDISEYTQAAENGYLIIVDAQAKGSGVNESSESVLFSYSEDITQGTMCR